MHKTEKVDGLLDFLLVVNQVKSLDLESDGDPICSISLVSFNFSFIWRSAPSSLNTFELKAPNNNKYFGVI